MTTHPEDPGAGEPYGIRHLASVRRAKAEELRTVTAAGLQRAIGVAGSGEWSARSATAFVTSAQAVLPEVTVLVGQLDSDAAALDRYAAAVEQLKARAAAVRAAQATRSQELAHSTRVLSWMLPAELLPISGHPAPNPATGTTDFDRARLGSDIADSKASLRHLDAQWADLVLQRRQADAACVASLSSTASRGGFAGLPAGGTNGLTPEQLLQRMAGLSSTELTMLFSADPGLAARVAKVTDPTAVAAWWRSYNTSPGQVDKSGQPVLSAQQLALLVIVPGVLGNLGGIPYTVRDSANRQVLAAQGKELRALMADRDKMLANGDGSGPWIALLQEHGYDSASFGAEWNTVTALEKSLGAAGGLTYQLVQFQPGVVPFAAISAGDMDTASQVTVLVPGMATTVSSSMQEQTGDARNLFLQQRALDKVIHSESGLAVVAWIGYDTPRSASEGHIEVVSSAQAKVGAVHLQGFLQGVTGARGWTPGENLSVVAHSYGTTTASLALVHTPVENLTMLASAGLDRAIPSVHDLQVPAGHVWASEASGDNVADLGRVDYSGSDKFSKAVWDSARIPIYDHPVDPTQPAFGARVFSSEGATVDGVKLHGSDWHSASPQVEAQLAGKTTDQYGYLDRLTTPLYNTGLTSLGLGDSGAVVSR